MTAGKKSELDNVLLLETELSGDRLASLTPEQSKRLQRKIDWK